jgi:metallo-beta-lactamase class B
MSSRFRHLFSFFTLLCLFSLPGMAQEASERDDPESQYVEPFQVFDNLYYIGARWVSSWLLVTDQGLIVFDALYDELTEMAIDNIRDLGFDPDDIRYLIVSHAHYDHVGGARRFQEEFAAVTMMTEEDWQMTTEPAVYREYPTPIRHLSASNGATLNLGRTMLRFMTTPGHTPGVLSTLFTVYDNGYPYNAMLFGGVGLNFSGVERTELYIDSIARMQQLQDIDVNITNHPSEDFFERAAMLQERGEDDPHPFVDPEGWTVWLETLRSNAEAKLAEERAAAN